MPRSENVGPRLEIWDGDGLVVIVAGVGKVAPAMATPYACDVFRPQAAVAIGLAGALEDGVRPGQVIVATGAVQHDMDGRPLTATRGGIPGPGLSTLSADPPATGRMTPPARLESRDASAGLVLTGDQIVTAAAVRD